MSTLIGIVNIKVPSQTNQPLAMEVYISSRGGSLIERFGEIVNRTAEYLVDKLSHPMQQIALQVITSAP